MYMEKPKPKYSRIVLKISGEALAGDGELGIDAGTLNSIAKQIKDIRSHGVEVAIVVGGGNIWRGIAGSSKGMDRATPTIWGCWQL